MKEFKILRENNKTLKSDKNGEIYYVFGWEDFEL